MRTFDFSKSETPAPDGAPREIVFYDSIHDLPMFRLNEFQIHLSQDAGIGSSLMDWDKRMDGVHLALSHNETANAIKELYNSRLGLFLMFEGISTVARCLADLVYSIDGFKLDRFDDESLKRVHQRIMQVMTTNQVSELTEALKKKFRKELKVAFPELFPEDEEMAFYAKIVRRAILQLDDCRGGDGFTHNPEISEIDKWLRNEMRPENFDFSNPANAVDARRREFEQVCTALAMQQIPNAEQLTAYKFHSRILYIHTHKPAANEPATHND